MEDGTWAPPEPPWRALASNLVASLPTSAGEVASIFWSGALAGFCLEAAVHGAQALHSRYEQLRRGHPLGTLGMQWWVAALRTPTRPRGPYQGAVGTLAAGTLWSGIFGSVYVPTRAVVDATVPPEQTAWGPAAAAAAGSIAASSVRVPLQVVKGRIQAHEFFCSMQAFELILRREGPRALYRGWVRSVSKNAPFDAVLFLLYDIGKTRVTERNRERVDAAATGGGSREASLAAAAGSQGQADPVASGVVMERVGAGSRDGAGDWDPGACSRAGAAAGGADESGSGGNEAELYPAADAALVGGLAGALTGLLTSPPEVWRLRGQLLQQQAAEAAATAAEAASAGGGGGGGHAVACTSYGITAGSSASLAGGGAAARHTAKSASTAAAGQRAALAAALRGSLRSRVLWAALEGAVFFSALETLIPLCDRALLPAADSQQHSAEPAAGGDGGSGFSETAGLLGGGSPLRHPAHPLHW